MTAKKFVKHNSMDIIYKPIFLTKLFLRYVCILISLYTVTDKFEIVVIASRIEMMKCIILECIAIAETESRLHYCSSNLLHH